MSLGTTARPPDLALPATSRTARRILLVAVFVCAACGLVYELALVALGSYLTGSSLVQTSLVLGFTMAAMGLGAFAVKPALRRPIEAFAVVEVTLGVVGALSVPALYAAFAWLNLYTGAMLVTATTIGALIGAEIPLLMELVQRVRRQQASGAVADLSAVDYGGALLGGLAFPFLLLPVFGLLRGALLVGGVNVVGAWVVAGWLFGRQLPARTRHAVSMVCVVVLAGLAAAAVYAAPFEVTARQRLYRFPIVHVERSPHQEIVLTSERWVKGREPDVRLYLNGDLQLSTIDEHRYHEALVHPAMDGPRGRVLVLGGGDGMALREVLGYDDVASVTLVDLDPAVVELARSDPRLVEHNDGAFADPRVTVVAADAFSWARAHRGDAFDAIIVDLPDPDSTETAKLYTVEFYGMLAGLLADGGRVVVQAGSPFFAPLSFWSIVTTVRGAGLVPLPYHVDVPSFGDWGFVLAERGPAGPQPHVPAEATDLEFLTPAVLDAATVFPPDRIPEQVRASTLLDPVILEYQRREWAGY